MSVRDAAGGDLVLLVAVEMKSDSGLQTTVFAERFASCSLLREGSVPMWLIERLLCWLLQHGFE